MGFRAVPRSTTGQQIAVMEDELAMRVRVYGRSVGEGRMDPEDAAEKIAIAEDILDRLRITAEGEAESQLPLVTLDLRFSAQRPYLNQFIAALPAQLRPANA